MNTTTQQPYCIIFTHVIHGPSYVSSPFGCTQKLEKHLHPIDLQNSAGFQPPGTRRNWVPWRVWIGIGNPTDSSSKSGDFRCRTRKMADFSTQNGGNVNSALGWTTLWLRGCFRPKDPKSWLSNPSTPALSRLIIHVHPCSPQKNRVKLDVVLPKVIYDLPVFARKHQGCPPWSHQGSGALAIPLDSEASPRHR